MISGLGPLLGGWLRLACAAILVVAINNLVGALRAGSMDPGLAALFPESFHPLWQIGLIVFGVHLSVIGDLAWRADFIHVVFGVLGVISGLGYIVDGFGTLLNPHYSLGLAMFTFIGEVVLIFRLLVRGRKFPDLSVSNAER
jgi:hypothetical protein